MSGESIRVLIETLCRLNEMPKLHDEEVSLMDTQPSISSEAVKRSYTNLGSINEYSPVYVLQKNNGLGFMVGIFDGDDFKYFLDIKTRNNPYPVVPTNLSEPYIQISYVSINDLFAEQGYTRSAYKFLVARYDLVSDHEQYLGGQRLWKSLAKESDVFIYVFDGNIGDYVRNENNLPLRYMNDSIDARKIWGPTPEHSKILLVAKRKEIK